jgi:hypothetical protein
MHLKHRIGRLRFHEEAMAAIPEPVEDGPERWHWLADASRETREAHPKYYWFHAFDGRPHFLWDEIEVSEQEYRAKVDARQLERLEQALADRSFVRGDN